MNSLNYKISIILLLISVSGFSQESFKESKFQVHSYAVKDHVDIELSNKYGAIKVNTWEKDSVRIEVNINAEAKKESDLAEMFNMLTFNHRQAGQYIIAETEWGRDQGQWQKTTYEVKKVFKENQRIEIEYTIYAPSYSEFFITNKFGDVYLPDLNKSFTCTVTHGNIKARNIPNAKKITIRYGKLKANDIGSCELISDYSEVQLNKCPKLNLESKSSQIQINDINELFLNSKNDNLKFEHITRVSGAMSGTDLIISKLDEKMDLTTKYGSVLVNNVNSTFRHINLTGSYSDYSLGYAENSSFQFGLNLEGGKEFTYPSDSVKILSDNSLDKTRNIEGQWGKGTFSPKVKINCKSGTIRFSRSL